MFTGIVEELGTIRAVRRGAASAVLSIGAAEAVSYTHLRKLKSESMFGDRVLELCAMADIVFMALHGRCGEDLSLIHILRSTISTAHTATASTPSRPACTPSSPTA